MEKQDNTARIHASTILHNELKITDDMPRIIKEQLADAIAYEIVESIDDNLPTIKFLQNRMKDETEYTVRINLISDKKYIELFTLDEENKQLKEERQQLRIALINALSYIDVEMKEINFETKWKDEWELIKKCNMKGIKEVKK